MTCPLDAKPGTRLVCVFDDPETHLACVKPELRKALRTGMMASDALFFKGDVLTLRAVVKSDVTVCGYAVQLEEFGKMLFCVECVTEREP